MGKLWSLIVGPSGDIIKQVADVIDRFVLTGEEKLKAQKELLEIERNFQLQVMSLDQKWAETQASVIMAEANSKSWLANSWRPILMLTFTYIVAHNYIIAPIFHVTSVPIPPDLWDLLRLGMGGYIIGRSVEKIAPEVTRIVTESKKPNK